MFIFSEDKFYFNVRATLCLVNTMYGGKFLANGADTCVYDPPVSCDPPTPGMDVQNKVSRIVSLTSGEREKQVLVQKVLKDIEPVFPRIRDFVNLASDSCTPKFKPEDEQQSCKVRGLSTGPLVNLITPKQGKDFYRYIGTPEFKTKFPGAMANLAVAMSYLNEYGLMHTDLHAANIAFMNGRLVAHDWGRAFDSRDEKKVKDYFDWVKSTKGVQGRGEYQRILPILNNTGYFTGLVKRTTKEGKQKLHLVLTRSWDTLALIGTSEYDGLINNEMVQRFLSAFVGIVAQNDADFSNNLRKIIPIAFTSSYVAPAVAPAVPAVAPVMVPPPPAPVKVKKTRKVKSKKVVAPVVPPVVPSPIVPPVVPPVVAPVVPAKSIPKSMYVSESPSNQEVIQLREEIAICDDEVDKLRNKVQQIAALTKLSPRR